MDWPRLDLCEGELWFLISGYEDWLRILGTSLLFWSGNLGGSTADLLDTGDVGAEWAFGGGKGLNRLNGRALGESCCSGVCWRRLNGSGSGDSWKSKLQPLVLKGTDGRAGGSKFKLSTPGIDVGRDIAAEVWLGWDELEQVTAGTGQHCDDAEACSPILSWSLLLSWLDCCCCLLFDLVFLGEKIWLLLGSSLLDTPNRLTSFNVWTAMCAERQMSEKYQTLCRETRTRYSSVPNALFLHEWLKLYIRQN